MILLPAVAKITPLQTDYPPTLVSNMHYLIMYCIGYGSRAPPTSFLHIKNI